jgi:tRNA pseudouridine55 synthase
MSLNGAFWIAKPAGLTSSDVVVRLKMALTAHGYFNRFPDGTNEKKVSLRIGHGGTLDPFATGVLVILVGEATKLADTYLHSTKTYSGIIALGKRTDTGDLTGTVVEEKAIPSLSSEEWQGLADHFAIGAYLQTPPMYSAKKQNGQVLHELARQGIEVERKAILKKIHRFEVNRLSETELSFNVRCESGTYVRVIAEDLAKKANTVAYLSKLERVQTSDATLDQCLSLEAFIEKLVSQISLADISNFKTMPNVAHHLSSMTIELDQVEELKNGLVPSIQALLANANHTFSDHRYVLVRDPKNQIVALLENQPGRQYRLQRVIHS